MLSFVVSLILIVLSLAPLSDRLDVARTRRTLGFDSFVVLLFVAVGVLTVGLSILNKEVCGVWVGIKKHSFFMPLAVGRIFDLIVSSQNVLEGVTFKHSNIQR